MPWGDGSGPNGMGPMTGRAAGYCAGYNAPGYANPGPGFGRGFGRGMGFGRGFGRGRGGFGRRFWGFGYAPRYAPYPAYANYPAAPAAPAGTVPVRYGSGQAYEYTKEDEIADLKADKEMIERELKAISERLKELETKK